MFGSGPPTRPADPATLPVVAAPPPARPAAPPQPPRGLLRAAELGDAWPFTVPEGVVSCVGRDGLGFAIFTAPDGTRYALNGAAKSRDVMSRLNLHDVAPIWRSNPDVPGLKVNIGPAIDAALKLCTM